MAIHEGKRIVLFLDGTELGFQDSVTLNIDSDMLELAADANGYREYLPDKIGGSISCSGLAGIVNGMIDNFSLGNALKNRTLLAFNITYEQTGQAITGNCYCSNWSPNGDATGYGTYSATLQITGNFNIG